jgi:hypothetical protein
LSEKAQNGNESCARRPIWNCLFVAAIPPL